MRMRAFVAAVRLHRENDEMTIPRTERSLRRLRRTIRSRDADSRARRARGAPTTRRSDDPAFVAELDDHARDYVGRPSPLSDAPRFSERVGAPVWLKREDLNHTGAHKINNTVGQVLLARRMGKQRIIAETGAGQHGVATATVCARFGLECVVYMGEEDMRRQALNVFRMRLMGATVVAVIERHAHAQGRDDAKRFATGSRTSTTRTTSSARSSGRRRIRAWCATSRRSSAARRARRCSSAPGGLPKTRRRVRRRRLERDGHVSRVRRRSPTWSWSASRRRAKGSTRSATRRRCRAGRPGVLHGALSYLLQDEHGQVHPAHSISAGLDYPGVGPEHSYLKDSGPRDVRRRHAIDEALEGFQLLSRLEGIIPALETAHAVRWIARERGRWTRRRRRAALRQRTRRQGRGASDVK